MKSFSGDTENVTKTSHEKRDTKLVIPEYINYSFNLRLLMNPVCVK
jgi:hypothetical protein